MDNELVVSEAQTNDNKSYNSLDEFLTAGMSVEESVEVAEIYAIEAGLE